MKIRKVIKAIKKRKNVRRKCWKSDIFIDSSLTSYVPYVRTSSTFTEFYYPDIEDLLANDWEVCDEN